MGIRIGIIEDTQLHGGTQMWSVEAGLFFRRHGGGGVTLLAPEGSWVVTQARKGGMNAVTYDYAGVSQGDESATLAWTAALSECDVALCTVHPPRGDFHPSMFASRCIGQARLSTLLVAKTGTIVPSYRREFYLPNEDISPVVIATTAFTRRYLIDRYDIPAEKVALLYQGIDLARFRAGSEVKYAASGAHLVLSEASPVLGCVGSFEERKGQMVLLRALPKILFSLPSAHLLLVGDGPDENALRGVVDTLHLTDAVRFVPFTRNPEDILARIDILVVPSLYKEGLPNVILEAMAMGVPVVSSHLAGIPEVVRDGQTGVLVSPGESRELAEAITQLWNDRNRYVRIRSNALRLVRDVFDRKSSLEEYLRFLERLVEGKNAPI